MKKSKNVLLIVNLGSPDLLKTHSIREFLRKFLSDKRVVNLPRLLWFPILYGIILPFRAPKLIHQYSKIWLQDGSPLTYYTKLQQQKLSNSMDNNDILVKHAFSYATPDIQTVLSEIHSEYKINKLTVIPLYPQFSSTTTSAVFDAVSKFYSNKKYLPTLTYIRDFHQHITYIDAVVKTIQDFWNINGQGDKLVFSYHGLPQIIIDQGDDYYNQCLKTTELIAEKLKINSDKYIIAFQSRFGKQKWLLPSTSDTLGSLARSNVANIDVICPGFVSDCLETLEEISVLNRELYLAAGGKNYNYINCLNADDSFINTLKSIYIENN